jgi:hypothetical protein
MMIFKVQKMVGEVALVPTEDASWIAQVALQELKQYKPLNL